MVIDYASKHWSNWSYDFNIDLSLPVECPDIPPRVRHYQIATSNGAHLLASADSLDELVALYPEYFI